MILVKVFFFVQTRVLDVFFDMPTTAVLGRIAVMSVLLLLLVSNVAATAMMMTRVSLVSTVAASRQRR